MRRLELTGQRFGKILVLSSAGSDKHGRTLWNCRCDCGTEYITTSGTLRSAMACKRCAQSHDLEGKRFGRLVAIEHGYGKNQRHYWLCQCDCGEQIVRPAQSLRAGKTTSCGHCSRNHFQIEGTVGIGTTAHGDQFLFDVEDYDRVSKYVWQRTAKGYFVSETGKQRVVLHRMVVNAPSDTQVDHINRDKADCRKGNLRYASNKENCANTGTYANNLSTGHKNVYLDGGRYRVIIRKSGTAQHFGYYAHLVDAIQVANEKRRQLFGEFAFYDPYPDTVQVKSEQATGRISPNEKFAS